MNGAAITVRRDMAPEIVRYVQGLVEMHDRWVANGNIAPKWVERIEDEIAKYNGHTHEYGVRYCGICGWDRRGVVPTEGAQP